MDDNSLILRNESTTIGNEMIDMIKIGKIKKHILHNSASNQSAEIERKELASYLDFIRTHFCYDIINLTGRENYE